jgi:hypothetical protein
VPGPRRAALRVPLRMDLTGSAPARIGRGRSSRCARRGLQLAGGASTGGVPGATERLGESRMVTSRPGTFTVMAT